MDNNRRGKSAWKRAQSKRFRAATGKAVHAYLRGRNEAEFPILREFRIKAAEAATDDDATEAAA